MDFCSSDGRIGSGGIILAADVEPYVITSSYRLDKSRLSATRLIVVWFCQCPSKPLRLLMKNACFGPAFSL